MGQKENREPVLRHIPAPAAAAGLSSPPPHTGRIRLRPEILRQVTSGDFNQGWGCRKVLSSHR